MEEAKLTASKVGVRAAKGSALANSRRTQGESSAPNRSCRLAVRTSTFGEVALGSGSGLEDGARLGAGKVLLEVARSEGSVGEIERRLERVHERLENVVRRLDEVGDGRHLRNELSEEREQEVGYVLARRRCEGRSSGERPGKQERRPLQC